MSIAKNKPNKPTVTVLIPALNEEKNITRIVKDSLKIKKYAITVLVIVDSKTKDKTALVAKKAGAKILKSTFTGGKGANIRYSIPFIKDEYAVQLDADYQFIPQEIPDLIEPLLHGYDVSLGTRYQKGAHVKTDSVSLIKLWGSHFLSFATTVFAGKRVTDVMAGFKGFKTPVLKDLNPKVNHFGYEAELSVRAARKNYKIINVPITYEKRSEGKSSVSSFKDGYLVLKTIIQTAFE